MSLVICCAARWIVSARRRRRAPSSVAGADAAWVAAAVTIADSGNGTPGVPARGGGGHGLVGMRERAALFGGTLTAGPRGTSGFEVRATLPYGDGSRS